MIVVIARFVRLPASAWEQSHARARQVPRPREEPAMAAASGPRDRPRPLAELPSDAYNRAAPSLNLQCEGLTGPELVKQVTVFRG
jgi:hypothetical protein